MKKFLKAAAGVLLAVCLVTGIAGCSEFDLAGEGTAYGVVGSYVGFITVRTDSEGKVTNVIIDEMQTPEHWAKKTAFDDFDEGDFLENGYAKKIVIGNKVFEASVRTRPAIPITVLPNTIPASACWSGCAAA